MGLIPPLRFSHLCLPNRSDISTVYILPNTAAGDNDEVVAAMDRSPTRPWRSLCLGRNQLRDEIKRLGERFHCLGNALHTTDGTADRS